jgi:hypothetical protein
VTQVAKLGNPHYSSHRSPGKSAGRCCRRAGGAPHSQFVLSVRSRPHTLEIKVRGCAASTSTANTRCKIPITGIACSAQILASMRTLCRIHPRIHLLYPLLVFMIIRRRHRYTHSHLQFGLHRVKGLVPVSIQITHHIYRSGPSPFPSINGHTFAFSCTTPIFQHEWLSLSFT